MTAWRPEDVVIEIGDIVIDGANSADGSGFAVIDGVEYRGLSAEEMDRLFLGERPKDD